MLISWQMCVYLVWFNSAGELRGEEQVLLFSRVVDIDQHPSLGVWLIEGVVHMRPATLLRSRSDRAIFVVVLLTANSHGIFIT